MRFLPYFTAHVDCSFIVVELTNQTPQFLKFEPNHERFLQ